MRLEHADMSAAKGWYLGPWNSHLEVSVGYATRGIDDPHFHSRMNEVYLVARGEAHVRVGERTLELAAGDVLVVEPGEPHTFLDSTPDYFHFVLHTPPLTGEAAIADRVPLTAANLMRAVEGPSPAPPRSARPPRVGGPVAGRE
jgi:mannose-6-phosphate isomerase-like protein (cupin superfamily)